MGYYEFNIKLSQDSTDALIDKLSEIGCLGIIINENSIIVYFPDAVYVDKVKKELEIFKGVLRDAGLPEALSYDYLYISERDWNESWKKKFQPIDVGENLTIIPPWQKPKPNRINLIIDPGMAFGTGHHETTMRCLILIERLSKKLSRKNGFLDVGTGTGILAIAAAKLGFEHIVGIDIDPLAIDASRRNSALNDITNIEVSCSSLCFIERSFDFIVANLLANTLIQLTPEIASHLNKEGVIVFSGIIDGQEYDVIEAYEKYNLHFFEKIVDGRWITLIASYDSI